MEPPKLLMHLVLLSILIFIISQRNSAQGPGNAIHLNGSDQYVDLGTIQGFEDPLLLSVESWIRKKEFSRIESIFTGGSFSLKIGADDKPYFELMDGSEILNDNILNVSDNIYALAVFNGKLYVGTSRISGGISTGRVYRYEGASAWTDVGKVGNTEWIYSLAVYKGNLYASTGWPGKIFRYNGENSWDEVGCLNGDNHARALIVFNDKLYCGGSGNVYCYNNDTSWTFAGTLGRDQLVFSLVVYNGELYGGGYHSRKVYKYDNDISWSVVGDLSSTGAYLISFAVYKDKLYAGTGGGMESKVFRYEGNSEWTDVGVLGDWNASLTVYNNKLYAGTSKNNQARLYRYEAGSTWTEIEQFESLQQVWAMVVYDGKLYIGAGNPFNCSGKVFSIGNGTAAYSNKALNDKYNHIAAVVDYDDLKIYVNGMLEGYCIRSFDSIYVSSDLQLGTSYGSSIHANNCMGEEYFKGEMDEVRIWNCNLDQNTIRDWMCRNLSSLHPDFNKLKYYYQFDEISGNQIIDNSGNNNIATLISKNYDSVIVCSGVPIGDMSANIYDRTFGGEYIVSLSHPDGDSLSVKVIDYELSGIQIFRIDEPSLGTGNLPPDSNWILDPLRYWGVYCIGDNDARFNLEYNFGNRPDVLYENDLALAFKKDHSLSQWIGCETHLNTITKTLFLVNNKADGLYALGSVNGLNILHVEPDNIKTNDFVLLQNYPNPFNPTTAISYQLPVSSDVTLKVFDILGMEVATLVDEYKPAGKYEVEFNASRLASGIYFYQLTASDYTAVKKMLLIR